MRKFYLFAMFVGAAVPLYFFIGFFAEQGFGPITFLEASFANRAASGLVADLLLSAFIALTFIGNDATRLGINKVWLVILGTCLIGLSFGLPLYLYWREGWNMSAVSPYTASQSHTLEVTGEGKIFNGF